MRKNSLEVFPLYNFFFADRRMAWLWLIGRVYVGWGWLSAGWEKFNDPTWIGSSAGQALTSFLNGSLAKTAGAHPDVQGWYGVFIQSVVMPNAIAWSYLVTFGEMLVGAALILGFLAGLSAFFGAFMNLNFMLAGSVSLNPIWFTISIGIILAWRIAGYWGLDYYVMPLIRRSG